MGWISASLRMGDAALSHCAVATVFTNKWLQMRWRCTSQRRPCAWRPTWWSTYLKTSTNYPWQSYSPGSPGHEWPEWSPGRYTVQSTKRRENGQSLLPASSEAGNRHWPYARPSCSRSCAASSSIIANRRTAFFRWATARFSAAFFTSILGTIQPIRWYPVMR